MLEPRGLRENFCLQVSSSWRPTVGNFLEQRHIRRDGRDRLGNAGQPVSSIESAYPLVYVPGQDFERHLFCPKTGTGASFVSLLALAPPQAIWYTPAVLWAQSNGSGVPSQKRQIMIDEIFSDLSSAAEKASEALKRELGKLRTGRAHPGMLDSVRVDYYGTKTPISQMAAIGVPEPRMLTVKPWDKPQVQAIDRAIRESGLGLNPQLDGDLIRVPVPPLSEERRKDLVKIAKKHGEECKIAIRKARHDALDILGELKKSGDASEDEVERAKKKVEEIATAISQSTDGVVAAKEKEILTV